MQATMKMMSQKVPIMTPMTMLADDDERLDLRAQEGLRDPLARE
jgi:hypothetical protein